MPGKTVKQGSVDAQEEVFRVGKKRLAEYKVDWKTVLVGKLTSKDHDPYELVDEYIDDGYKILVDPQDRNDAKSCAVTGSPRKVLMGMRWEKWHAMDAAERADHAESIDAIVAEYAEKGIGKAEVGDRTSLGKVIDGLPSS